MRLTLRTLLAWLDDTLPPSEVREIGRQVSDSPFAKELVERVHRVTRQRRLTVPSRSGPEATDPNLVASYLDNELPADQVADFEKQCLTSDVHLAEVASVHQILSLIGQKAKVPAEARHRMYQLVKGRESVSPKTPRASQAEAPAPVSEPIQPWVTPEPPQRPWIERFGPVAAVLALILVLCLSAWQSLSPPTASTYATAPVADVTPDKAAVPERPVEKVAAKGQEEAAVPKTETEAPAPEAAPKAATTDETPVASDTESTTKPSEPAAESILPPGFVGRAEKPSGVLLRYNPEKREWDRLTEETPLKHQDRLLSLQPFRSTVVLGNAKIELVGETEIWVLSAMPNEAGRLSVVQGRVLLKASESPAPFAIQFAKKTIQVKPPQSVPVGIERQDRRDPGAFIAADPVLKIFAPEGEVALEAGDLKETLAGPGTITFEPRGAWTNLDTKAAPAWVIDPKPTPHDLQTGEQFLSFFKDGRPVVTTLVDALESDQMDVRRLAIAALRPVDVSYIVAVLKKPDDRVSRRTAISALHAVLNQGPDAARDLRALLQNDFGEEFAATVEKLLVGYSAKEAREPATYTKLVDLLNSPEVAIRELALENLLTLTGRDDLGYDPDLPQGKGLRAWKDLDHSHELVPRETPKAPADAKPAR